MGMTEVGRGRKRTEVWGGKKEKSRPRKSQVLAPKLPSHSLEAEQEALYHSRGAVRDKLTESDFRAFSGEEFAHSRHKDVRPVWVRERPIL